MLQGHLDRLLHDAKEAQERALADYQQAVDREREVQQMREEYYRLRREANLAAKSQAMTPDTAMAYEVATPEPPKRERRD